MQPHDRRFLLALSLVAFGLAGILAIGPLAGVAHVSDEVAYTLQARLFASGMRAGPPADEPSLLLYPFWQTTPRSFAIFPPGWPALLAAGVTVGAPWLVNALASACLPALSWLLARAWQRPDEESRLAAMVAALSPGVVLLAGSRMAHTSVLVGLLLALVVVERRRDPAGPGDPPAAWLAAGLALAYVVLASPFDALIVGGPILAVGLLRATRSAARLGLLLPPALAIGLLLLDNQALTGNALRFPVDPWFDAWVADMGREAGCSGLGFGDHRDCHPTFGSWGHDPGKAMQIALETGVLLDRFLLGIPGGLVLVLLGLWRSRLLAWPLGLTLAVVGGYALFWSPGNVFGARFWHPLYLVLPVLLAAGLGALPPLLRQASPLLLALGCLNGLGRAAIELMDGYLCVDDRVADLLQREGIEEGLVYLAGGGGRTEDWPWLGREGFACDPLLTSGSAIQFTDPTRVRGGLQIRHALPDSEGLYAYWAARHPDARAWLIVHDLERNEYRIRELSRAPEEAQGASPATP